MTKLTAISSILASILLVGASCSKSSDTFAHTDLYEDIKSVDKMAFASMSITKTAKSERNDWYKIGKHIAVYSYDSYIRAYIDLSSLTPGDLVFNEKDKSVKIQGNLLILHENSNNYV